MKYLLYFCIVKQFKRGALDKRHTKNMKNEHKQLEIFQRQIEKAMDIVIQQKKRYEELQSQFNQYKWTCEDDGAINEIAIGLLQSLGGLEQIYENLYN